MFLFPSPILLFFLTQPFYNYDNDYGSSKGYSFSIFRVDPPAEVVDDGYIPTSESSDSNTETPPSAHQLSESVLSENDEVPNVMLTSEPNKNAADIPDPSNDTSIHLLKTSVEKIIATTKTTTYKTVFLNGIRLQAPQMSCKTFKMEY